MTTTAEAKSNAKKFKSTARSIATSLLTVVISFVSVSSAQAEGKSADKSFVCNNPDVRGGWGALKLGCDADQFGDVERIQSIYPMLVFDRRNPDPAHLAEYLTNMNAIIRKVAHDYYLQRIPDAKPKTLEAFMRATVAMGAHESMMSHYRISADGNYKLMTGDHLVSHGVMQVNQNYHSNKDYDTSFDLVGNVVGGLDEYFLAWNNALKQQCFWQSNGAKPSLETMLENRARSAYSAYNGGPSRLCRYTNTTSRFKEHDEDFRKNYHDQPVLKFITDQNRPSPVNTACILNGDDLCAMAKPARDHYVKSRPLVFPDGKTCLTSDGTTYTCATDMRVFSCLAKIDPKVLDHDPVKLPKIPSNAKVRIVQDREPLCMKAVKGLIKVGSTIVLNKEILVRKEIGGSPIGNTHLGRVYQVVDYDLRLGGKTERFYKIVMHGDEQGWIYGGSDEDFADWLSIATPEQIEAAKRAVEEAKAARLAAKAAAAAAASQAAADDAKVKVPEETEIVVTAPRKPTPTPIPRDSILNWNIHDILGDLDTDEIQPVLPVAGSVVEIVRDSGVYLRTAAGEDETTAPLDQIVKSARLTVEEVATLGTENKIYLKVTQGGKTGWIYSGRTFPDVTISKWIKIWK